MNYFQKILELQEKMPRASMNNLKSVNSDYTMHSADNKNCYLLIGSERDEDCMYGNWVYESRDCADCDFVYKCELCWQSLDLENCYGCNFCQDCTTCTDCSYCYDCKGCTDCFGSAGLRNKKFHIFNKPYKKEEYFAQKEKILDEKSAEKNFEEIKRQIPRICVHATDNQTSVGDYIYHCKDSFYCFDGKNLEDCVYMTSSIGNKDCIDCSNVYFGCELCYEIMSAIELYNCNFCNFCYYGRDMEYCESCYHCSDCFGSFYLQHKQFYIFNEPYKKEDYFEKLAEIKAAMRKEGTYGKLLPSTIKFEDSAVGNYWRN